MKKQTVKPSVFGQDLYDCHLGEKLISASDEVHCLSYLQNNPTVLLAKAYYDLSELVMGLDTFEMCYNLENPLLRKISDGYCIPSECVSLNKVETPFTNAILADNYTCLTIRAKTTTSMNDMYRQACSRIDVINRIFMVLENYDEAKEILRNIYEINKTFLGPSIIGTDLAKTEPNGKQMMIKKSILELLHKMEKKKAAPMTETLASEPSTHESKMVTDKIPSHETDPTSQYKKKALTGFVIDNFDKIIIFIEGEMNGSLQIIWSTVMTLPREKGYLLHDSSLVFENRLYADFISYGGFHVVNLRAPLNMYLANPKTYMEGNIPVHTWKTFMKLDLLLKSNTMKAASQNQLFPTVVELLNFDKEFGIPLHHKDDDDDDVILSPANEDVDYDTEDEFYRYKIDELLEENASETIFSFEDIIASHTEEQE
ncbi:uncharacterized protein [Periplaneta americana]|uniref:uncharacterized protein n=1 Tax=Periplaneta americana TaxID=6978 RepID=UPI0037E93E72